VLLGRGAGIIRPDVVLCVLDASHLDRNLYLLTQVLELGVPVVVALTMMDLAQRNGIVIDVDAVERQLGVPVVPVHSTRRTGFDRLRETLVRTAQERRAPQRRVSFPASFDREVDGLQKLFPQNGAGTAVPGGVAVSGVVEVRAFHVSAFRVLDLPADETSLPGRRLGSGVREYTR